MTNDKQKILQAAQETRDLIKYLELFDSYLELNDADGDIKAEIAQAKEHLHLLGILLEGRL